MTQLDFLKNKDLGFNKDQMVVIPGGGQRNDALKTKLLQNPNVASVSFARNIPGRSSGDDTYLPEGKDPDDTVRVSAYTVDFDFAKTFEIDIVAGRDFSEEFSTDIRDAVLINEKAAADIGWGKEAVGKQIVNVSRNNVRKTIIGIVKDFHHKSLKLEINPVVIAVNPRSFRYTSARIHPSGVSSTLKFIENTWKDSYPDRDFSYFFIDDDFRSKYPDEERVRSLYFYFGFLALFVAGLGLFGLASFIIERRTKEIGIRKVLGAGINKIVFSLSGEFIKWVLLANILAWPVAYFIMNNWLQNFAYRIHIQWWMFIISGFVALIIAVLTVSYQAVKSARANPVDSIRYE
jgi:putative ABC transport system permease protein